MICAQPHHGPFKCVVRDLCLRPSGHRFAGSSVVTLTSAACFIYIWSQKEIKASESSVICTSKQQYFPAAFEVVPVFHLLLSGRTGSRRCRSATGDVRFQASERFRPDVRCGPIGSCAFHVTRHQFSSLDVSFRKCSTHTQKKPKVLRQRGGLCFQKCSGVSATHTHTHRRPLSVRPWDRGEVVLGTHCVLAGVLTVCFWHL